MKVIASKDDIKQRKRRSSKNKKKSWKRIDLTDIDKFQEEQRRDERIGYVLENKSLDELFSLDTGSDTTVHPSKKATQSEKKLQKGTISKTGLRPSRKPIQRQKLLKCHEFLNGLPGARPIYKKQGVNKQRTCSIIRNAMKLSKNTPVAEKKRKQVMSQRRKQIKENRTVKDFIEHKDDIWSQDDKRDIEMFGDVGNTYMEEPMDYYKTMTKTNKVKVPSVRYKKTSALPAVAPPKPGASYNPSYDDHQSLLAEAVKMEEQRLKGLLKEQRMVKKYLPSKDDGITQEEWLQEMSEGIALGDYQMEDSTDENCNLEVEGVTGAKRQEKKSNQSRKRAQTQRIKEQLRLEKKERKRLESQVYSVKAYGKEIHDRENKLQMVKDKKMKKNEEKKFLPKKLSQHKFQEEDLCVPLGSDLSGSLRTVKPMGNPLVERYKNLQRRNILDTRIKIKRAQPKTKKIKKKHIKEDMKEFIESLLK